LANTKSALKARRVSERRHERNRAVRSSLRTFVKKARASVTGAVADQAPEQIKEAVKHLDQAASKGIIHRNQAARRKSRLMHQLALMQAGTAPVATTTRTRKPAARSGAAKPATRTRTTRAKA
jgi:small subunit ribosomal protein S20